jgi:hypothetical protein
MSAQRTGAPRIDTEAVVRIVGQHADRIGCDTSNRTAAIAWATRHGTNTIHACAIGRNRADVLRNRQGEAA